MLHSAFTLYANFEQNIKYGILELNLHFKEKKNMKFDDCAAI